MFGYVTLRFYEELNDFLHRKYRKKAFRYAFASHQTIKDVIEACGVPHTEIDLILVNSKPVDFSYRLRNEDYISVYPVFEKLDISGITKIDHSPLRNLKFVADVHLGKLARYLRMIGFDTLYENNSEDTELIEISNRENRILLTRDKGILMNSKLTHGSYIYNHNSKKQLAELIKKFQLQKQTKPFSRCIECNGEMKIVSKNSIQHLLNPLTNKYFNEFYMCTNCEKIYWKGSHYDRMKKFIEKLLVS